MGLSWYEQSKVSGDYMWICDGTEKKIGAPATVNNTNDMLNAELINSLGYLIGEKRCGTRYDIETICVETGLLRFNVCGMIECGEISDFSYIIGDDGIKRNVDDFYLD